MANRWGIPKVVEDIVIARDKRCVYCQSEFDKTGENRKTRSTWEHIINDIKLNKEDNIALCCGSCNASKGSKLLEDWLKSKYCLDKKITKETVSEVIKNHIDN
jgi:5-methylcytosine-specific restriction endonuclease McrA